MTAAIEVTKTMISEPDRVWSYAAEQTVRGLKVRVSYLYHLTHFDTVHPISWIITIGEGRQTEDYTFEGNVLKSPYSRLLKRRKTLRDAIKTMSVAIRKTIGHEGYPIQIDTIVHR